MTAQDIAFTLTVNDQEYPIAGLDRLRERFDSIREREFAEVWLNKADGKALALLKNQDRAWLLFLRHQEGDSGFSSRNPDYTGPEDATLEFLLSNGQMDEYPAAWCLPLEETLRALEHFYLHGEKAPWIHWHED